MMRTAGITQMLLVLLWHVSMTSCDSCAASCVYGRCSSPAADDVITCTCVPGYAGRYCHLLDTNRITATPLSNTALLNFTQYVKVEDINVTISPYNDLTYLVNDSNSIAVHNLQASTEYQICMSTIFNRTGISYDVLRTDDKTDILATIKPEPVCISLTTKGECGAIYVHLALASFCIIFSIVMLLFLCHLFQCIYNSRGLTFYNIPQVDESKLQETIYDIFEKKLEISGARQILFQRVYRKRVRESYPIDDRKRARESYVIDDPNNWAAVVYFDSADDRRMVLRHAHTSNTVKVDGNKIILPLESGC